jgi:hypothetical protein
MKFINEFDLNNIDTFVDLSSCYYFEFVFKKKIEFPWLSRKTIIF